MPEKKMGFVDKAVDTVARKMKIGGLEKKDGSYTATSDLSPEDQAKVKELGKVRDVVSSRSPALRASAEMITGRKKKEVQQEINDIYAGKKKQKPEDAMEEMLGRIAKDFNEKPGSEEIVKVGERRYEMRSRQKK
jgi:hypothetical protein